MINEKGRRRLHTGGRLQLWTDHKQWLQKFIRAKGGQDLAVEFFLDVTNFAPVLSRIQAAKPDIVWSALVGDAHMSFDRQFESTIGKKNRMLASGT
jgi:branched-chain amino acid transport system substrate-binding protein